MFQVSAAQAQMPFWLDILKSVIGPLIAAIVFILGLLWRDRIERRNAAQDWFEQTLITEGLDVVIPHLAELTRATLDQQRGIPSDLAISRLPFSVTRKLFGVYLGDFLVGLQIAESFTLAVTSRKNPLRLTDEEEKELLDFCLNLELYADAVRLFFLKTKITTKNEVYEFTKSPKFTEFLESLNDTFSEKEDIQAAGRRMRTTLASVKQTQRSQN